MLRMAFSGNFLPQRLQLLQTDDVGLLLIDSTALPGIVMPQRINDPSDDIANPADGEQWFRSKVAQYIKNKGTPGTMGDIPKLRLRAQMER